MVEKFLLPALIVDKPLVLSDPQFRHLQNEVKNSNLAGVLRLLIIVLPFGP